MKIPNKIQIEHRLSKNQRDLIWKLFTSTSWWLMEENSVYWIESHNTPPNSISKKTLNALIKKKILIPNLTEIEKIEYALGTLVYGIEWEINSDFNIQIQDWVNRCRSKQKRPQFEPLTLKGTIDV